MQKISKRTPYSLQRDQDMLLEGGLQAFLGGLPPPFLEISQSL